MGKGTDKLYITHSEWSSSDAYGASAGSAVNAKGTAHASFKRLPFNFCSLSLQPFETPVCTSNGTIFDHENIIRWLQNHKTSPIDGTPLSLKDLIKLQFAKNEAGEYVDPVTYKIFTDNTHIIAIRHGDSANVFAYDTVERLNIKPKMWKDLVTDEDFSRKDMITLQDPQNLESRNLSSFKYLVEGQDSGVPKEASSINTEAIGSSAKIIKAKEAVAKARAERAAVASGQKDANSSSALQPQRPNGPAKRIQAHSTRSVDPKASHHTTGLAAASFTSTGVTPHTSASLALLTDEEYLLKRGRVKHRGYARMQTTSGDLDIELQTEYAPKAVWNFIRLAQKGYYNGVAFHRNIRSFMIQGGDETGTGKGGKSIWGKNFEDEFDGPLKHDSRGIMSMANKGKNTNSSQFFILYRPAKHLDYKHTIFGKVVEGLATLDKLENVPTDAADRPKEPIKIITVNVLIDPFEEFWNKKKENENAEKEKEQRRNERADDEKTTWTGKRIRQEGEVGNDDLTVGVGKYLKSALQHSNNRASGDDEIVEYIDEPIEQPVKKKVKSGGFGNFDGW